MNRRNPGVLPLPSHASVSHAGLLAATTLALLVFLVACGDGSDQDDSPFEVSGSSGAQPFLAPTATPEMEAWVEETLAGLGLEEKVGQLICTDVYGDYRPEDDQDFQRWIGLARDHGVGMFVLYGGTPRDVANLTNRLQEASKVPLIISADFEGGPGQQVVGASEFPGVMGFSAAGSTDLMHRAASAAAVEGRAMGIHLTYTPVVDVESDPTNPAQSVRSFGGDLELLGEMVQAYVRGFHANGMLTTAKHFPGRGDIDLMPGNDPWTWIDKTPQEVEEQDFRGFKVAIDAGVDFVMSEHIAIPSVTEGSELPASVEEKLVSEWLRDRLGFEGILTSDDLWYDHVVERFGAEEVAVLAFEAGHDMILKPKDPVATIGALVAAVESGRISQERVDDAVRRLLTLKARLGLHEGRFVREGRVGELVGIPDHQALVQEVADRSLTLLRNEGVLPVSRERLGRVVNISVQKAQTDPSPSILAAALAAAFPGARSFTLRPGSGAGVYDSAWGAVAEADLVVISLFVPRTRHGDTTPIRETDLAFLLRVIAAKPERVVAMAYGNPHLIRELPNVPAFLVGYGERGWYGNQEVYFDTFMRALTGALHPTGRLPVLVSDQYPIGSGMGY